MAKLWQTEMFGEVVDACLQLFGGYGYMLEYPVTRAFMDARVQRIFAGTNEIMKVIIAKQMGI
jgi:acyl-CoA dehydrogenase